METLILADRAPGRSKQASFHDASEHGITWVLLNELLHIIVFIYTLYGMIQFKVKFIHRERLMRAISFAIVAHSWYLTIKFALIALVLYLFNEELESRSIAWSDYNCSLANHRRLFDNHSHLRLQYQVLFDLIGFKQRFANTSITYTKFSADQNERISLAMGAISSRLKYLTDFFVELDYPRLYAQLLHHYGGPFKLLGNRTTLMYGFYSIAIYIMLAIFPIELTYLRVGFNYIRFVLSDTSCMRELYNNRKRHLDRLSSWSRNQTDSELTLGTKIALNQRDLRSRYADDCNRLTEVQALVVAQMSASSSSAVGGGGGGGGGGGCAGGCSSPSSSSPPPSASSSLSSIPSSYSSSNTETALQTQQQQQQQRRQRQRLQLGRIKVESKLYAGLKPLKPRLAINHLETPSYAVRVANRNLESFKPYVRSEAWFKSAMIIYPMFIFFYFTMLILVIGAISMYFQLALQAISSACAKMSAAATASATATTTAHPRIDSLANWSNYDLVLYFENQYTVFALSCASSFYCSYYFGTISELYVWVMEISQQLDLCKIIIELTEDRTVNHLTQFTSTSQSGGGGVGGLAGARMPAAAESVANSVRNHSFAGPMVSTTTTTASVLPNGKPSGLLYKLVLDSSAWTEANSRAHRCANDFGGFNCFWRHLKASNYANQSERLKLRELMAIKLLNKKQTLLRATYINMCLFLDELNDTRFMTKTILRRTTQIAFGFAMMASITRSQFQANYWHLTFLLAACLAILNLYLACAAIINSSVNKLLVQVHSLISASLRTNSEDADLFEFWVRHIRSFGEDRDVMSYKIYGYKITWATILNFDSAVCTAYFYTIY